MKTIKETIGFVIFAAVFFFVGYGCAFSKYYSFDPTFSFMDGSTGKAAYEYTVSDKTRCWVHGKEVSVKEYQRALLIKDDGKPGMDTANQTMFFNASEAMFTAGTR